MPRYTEERIKMLCKEAVAARTKSDLKRVTAQLREALEEHISLARRSLSAQASVLPILEARKEKKQPRQTSERR